MTETDQALVRRRNLIERRLRGELGDRRTAAMARLPRTGSLSLSFAQRRMWFLGRLLPGSVEYVLPLALRLRGRLDVEALRRAVSAMVSRHEVLRTRYAAVHSEPVQIIDAATAMDLEPIDADGGDLAGLIEREANRPFDLAAEWPLRVLLVRLRDDEHVLVLTVHHIAFDGWSFGVFVRELGALYSGEVLGELPVQYADFAAWQRERLSGRVLDELLGYWRGKLTGLAPTELPLDRVRSAVRESRGGTVSFTVPAEVSSGLLKVGRDRGATPFMTLLAVFKVLLARYCDAADVAVGTPIAGRSRAEVQDLIGFFVNTLVLRTDLSGDPTFGDVVDRVRETALGAYAHQDLPFERLVEELDLERDLSRTPLFQVMFQLGQAGHTDMDCGGLAVEEMLIDWATARFDLTMHFEQHADGSLSGHLIYPTALFDRETIERLAGHYLRLAGEAATGPDVPVDRLGMVTEAERRTLVEEWNDTDVEYPTGGLHELVEEQVQRTPDAVAVWYEDRRLTYAELDAEANRFSHHLRSLGVGAESLVGVRLRRGVDLVVVLLGVLKAGGGYVPLDPDQPRERLDWAQADTGATVVITQESVDRDRELVRRYPADSPSPLSGPDTVAYVIFTSGSTGRPKGVLVEHRAIRNRILWMQDAYGLTAADRVLQKTPYGFDVSLWEFFWPLAAGACLVVASPGGHRDPGYLAEVIASTGVTTVHFVPSMLREFLAWDGVPPLPSLERVICSGEALPPDLVRSFSERFDARLYNLYGPTEAAVDVTATRCVPGEPVTIGRPVANTRVYIVDSHDGPVPVGVPGELVLAGVQVARGYVHRPAWTAERFVPDPFGSGDRWYRTGDLARYRRDGTIELLGRLDNQVKVRGFRIELDEVANALTRLPAVRAAAAASHDERLVGYVVPADGAALEVSSLRQALAETLPDYLIPSLWVLLAALPLNTSGKLDRTALPSPSGAHALDRVHVPPRTPVERVLADAFAVAVGVSEVGVHDGFFEIGGDSIRVLRLVGTLHEHGYDMSVQDVFRNQTVAELAPVLSKVGVDDRRTGPFELLDPTDRGALRAEAGIADAYPLSMVQAGMVYEMLADTKLALYHNVTCYLVRDDRPLSLPALTQAAQTLVSRHEALRTSIDLTAYTEPLQFVHANAVLRVRYEDLRGMSVAERDTAVQSAVAEERDTPFDIRRPPLLRLRVQQVTDTAWRLTVTECHAILDGWSHSLLLAELLDCYGGATPAPLAGVRFADAIALELRSLRSPEDRDFWASRVTGHDRLAIPEAWARAPGDRPFTIRRVEFSDLEPRLRELAGVAGAPLKSVLLAAHLTVLGALHGPRFFTGLVCNGRPETVGGDQVRGMFLNTVPFAVDLDTAGTWEELVRAVFAEEVELWPHRHFPLPAMQREWGRGTPLIDVFFNYLDFHVLDDENLDHAETIDVTWNEFALTVATEPGVFVLDAATDRIGPDQLALLARMYRQVVETMAADPAGDPRHWRLPGHDRDLLLGKETWNATAMDVPAKTLPELFVAQVRETPDAVAVVCDGRQLSYGELNDRVNEIAHLLRSLGVGPGALAGVFLERGVDLLATLLAVLKTGGAYLPLDPTHPAERLGFMLADAGASTVVTQTSLVGQLAGTTAHIVDLDLVDSRPAGEPDLPARPDDLAYVIYTSGSTGRPKGVMITHAGLTNFLMAVRERPGVAAGSTVAALTTVTFDPSVLELFLPLLTGARIVVASPRQARDPRLISEVVGASAIVQATPVVLRMLLDSGWTPAEGLTILCGGEKLPADLTRQLSSAGACVWDLYGPTETTVWSTTARMHADGSALDWAAGANVVVHVLNRYLEPVPLGVLGEVYIGGAGLGWGYTGRPGLTASCFVPDPYADAPGRRLYRTGDLARRYPDGRLEIVGRADHQVKIRGHRIEPAEIEAALLDHPAVHAAVVHPTSNDGGHQLNAYLVRGEETVPAHAELREYLGRTLPDYMIPAAFVVLDEYPLTPSGKVDRGRLPVPRTDRGDRDHVAPRTDRERETAAVWAQVLGMPRIGVHENFFDLGGHSLLATRIAVRLRTITGVEVPVRAVFDFPTIATLTAALPGYPLTAEPMGVLP